MNAYKYLRIGIIFLVIFAWVFLTRLNFGEILAGKYPPINFGGQGVYIFAQEATSTPGTPAVATSTPQTATATSTPEAATSTFQAITSSSNNEVGISGEGEIEGTPIPEQPQPAAPPLPPLKERKLNKTVRWDNNAGHFCRAKNFSVNISNQNQVIVELELGGRRRDAELLEVGSLPLGIDITFLNNANYEWQPSKNESAAVLRIINQPGSQKGNFTVPMIYESGASTTICQINLINF